jgi:predicted ATPase
VSEYLKDKYKIKNRERDLKEILNEIKSQHSERTIRFHSNFEVSDGSATFEIEWSIEFLITITDVSIKLISEKIAFRKQLPVKDIKPDESTEQNPIQTIYLYKSNIGKMYIPNEDKFVSLMYLDRNASILKSIEHVKQSKTHHILSIIKSFITSCQSFEMLSPEWIKHSSRGKTNTIGRNGEKLAAFLRQLQNGNYKHFLSNIKDIIPNTEAISTNIQGRPGWIELTLKENFGDNTYSTRSNHISDGMLRILALVAITEMPSKCGMILLDEIEDGLNPHITEKVIKLLESFVRETNRQILITTHSVVILMDFKPEEIQYVYRDSKGFIQITKAFIDNQDIRDMLAYMNPGEIWLSSKETDFIAENR